MTEFCTTLETEQAKTAIKIDIYRYLSTIKVIVDGKEFTITTQSSTEAKRAGQNLSLLFTILGANTTNNEGKH